MALNSFIYSFDKSPVLQHWEYNSKQNRYMFAFLKLALLWVRQAIRRQLYNDIYGRKERPRVMEVGVS